MGETPEPTTTAVVTGWRKRIDPRRGLRRVQESSIAILQIVVAATGAYAFAHYVLGHPAPLLAATVSVSSLGLVRDARPRRVLETVLGMLVGILVAELLLLAAGPGWWQLALALGLTLIVARFLSAQASFAIAAAIQSLIVMVIPADAPFLRLVDGVVGGVARSARDRAHPAHSAARRGARRARRCSRAMDSAMGTLAQALRRGDRMRAERGLEKARALQPLVDGWPTSLDSGIAIARISPFLRRQRFELQRHERIRQSIDLATRNLRVIAPPRRLPLRRRRGPAGRGRRARRPRAGGAARRPVARRHLARAHRARSGAQRGGSPRPGRSCCPMRRSAIRTSSRRCGRSRSTC